MGFLIIEHGDGSDDFWLIGSYKGIYLVLLGSYTYSESPVRCKFQSLIDWFEGTWQERTTYLEVLTVVCCRILLFLLTCCDNKRGASLTSLIPWNQDTGMAGTWTFWGTCHSIHCLVTTIPVTIAANIGVFTPFSDTSISIISFVHWLTPYLYPIFDADVSSIWRLKKIFPAGGSSGARLRKCW